MLISLGFNATVTLTMMYGISVASKGTGVTLTALVYPGSYAGGLGGLSGKRRNPSGVGKLELRVNIDLTI